MVVYKYAIDITDEPLNIPQGRILQSRLARPSIGGAGGAIEFWVEHDAVALVDGGEMGVQVVGTGHPFDPRWTAAVTCFDGPFVWHLIVSGATQ